jgi:hypothetical protein
VRKKLGSSDTRSQKDIPITEFFNTHACLQHQSTLFFGKRTASNVHNFE